MKKNKKYFISLALIAIILLSSVSCLTPPTTASTPAATTVTPLAQVQEKVNVLETKLNEKASTAQISALDARITELTGKVNALQAQGTGNAYTKTETYTKAEVDAAIAALKSNQSWITVSTSTTSTTTTPTTNNIAVKTYSISPSTMIYAGGNYDIFVEVKNGYADAKKVVLSITLTPDQYTTRVQAYPATKFVSDSPYITGTGDKMSTNVSAGDCDNYTNLIQGTTNYILIGGNSTALIHLTLTLAYCLLPSPPNPSPQAIWSPIWSSTILP